VSIKIYLFHKLPTPYNDHLFCALHNNDEIDLQVYHLWKSRWNRPWKSELAKGYPNIFLNTKFFGIDLKFTISAIREKESFFIIGDWAHPSSIIVLLIRILLRYPVSIWADTPQEQLYRPWYKKIPRKLFLSFILNNLDVIFATGKPGVNAIKKMGIRKTEVVNLPCFVQIENLQQNQNKSFSNFLRPTSDLRILQNFDFIILSSGMCTYKKGHDITIKAFKKLLCSTDLNPILLIAGEGPEKNGLINLTRELNISENVKFLGWLEPDDMKEIYSISDILVHSARWDPYPLVVLEAMSFGLVVVGSDVSGSVQDRIINGKNGFSFQNENIEELTKILNNLLNCEIRKIIGKNARKTAEEWPVERGVSIVLDTTKKIFIHHGIKYD